MTRVGIIICDRWRRCAGGKCLRALENREGAFARYAGREVRLVGYTTCDGCPGGNIEYAGNEMRKNGVEVIHLATGLVVGYPPCPYLQTFKDFLEARYPVEVVIGTHPIPTQYLEMHTHLRTWGDAEPAPWLKALLADAATREAYQ